MYKKEKICRKCWKEWLEKEDVQLDPNFLSGIGGKDRYGINQDNYWQFFCPAFEGINDHYARFAVIFKDKSNFSYFCGSKEVSIYCLVPESCFYFLEQYLFQGSESIGQII